jgi:CheY-like chemotaxis protein
MTKILWFDNDTQRQTIAVDVLRKQGYEVKLVPNLTEAESSLAESEWDLLILDVQIPIAETEVEEFPPDQTAAGHSTGLAFFRRHKDELRESDTQVLVLTVRTDEQVRKEFMAEGLPEEGFATKYGLRDMDDLLDRVKLLLTK